MSMLLPLMIPVHLYTLTYVLYLVLILELDIRFTPIDQRMAITAAHSRRGLTLCNAEIAVAIALFYSKYCYQRVVEAA